MIIETINQSFFASLPLFLMKSIIGYFVMRVFCPPNEAVVVTMAREVGEKNAKKEYNGLIEEILSRLFNSSTSR